VNRKEAFFTQERTNAHAHTQTQKDCEHFLHMCLF